jgi:hypothetical protein
LDEQYRSLSSYLRSLLHSPVTSSLLDTNILLNILFWNTLSICSSLNVSDQVSHTHTHTHTQNKLLLLLLLLLLNNILFTLYTSNVVDHLAKNFACTDHHVRIITHASHHWCVYWPLYTEELFMPL